MQLPATSCATVSASPTASLKAHYRSKRRRSQQGTSALELRRPQEHQTKLKLYSLVVQKAARSAVPAISHTCWADKCSAGSLALALPWCLRSEPGNQAASTHSELPKACYKMTPRQCVNLCSHAPRGRNDHPHRSQKNMKTHVPEC